MPRLFFTWALRADKTVHYEFLDNSVPEGQRPRTVAFGWNGEMNILDVKCLLDVERYRKIDVQGKSPAEVYPDARTPRARQQPGLPARVRTQPAGDQLRRARQRHRLRAHGSGPDDLDRPGRVSPGRWPTTTPAPACSRWRRTAFRAPARPPLGRRSSTRLGRTPSASGRPRRGATSRGSHCPMSQPEEVGVNEVLFRPAAGAVSSRVAFEGARPVRNGILGSGLMGSGSRPSRDDLDDRRGRHRRIEGVARQGGPARRAGNCAGERVLRAGRRRRPADQPRASCLSIRFTRSTKAAWSVGGTTRRSPSWRSTAAPACRKASRTCSPPAASRPSRSHAGAQVRSFICCRPARACCGAA